MLRILFAFALFVHLGSAGNAQSCATQPKIEALNTNVMNLGVQLVAKDLVTMDMTTGVITVPDENIPPLLETLCNTTELKQILFDIETALQDCQDLLISSPSLQQLTIKGVSFAEMFAAFGDVNNFCDCREPLPHAWALKLQANLLAYEDPSAAYTKIAAVNNLCGVNLKPVIMSLGGRPDSDSCKLPLLSQAGYTTPAEKLKVEKMKMLVDSYCTSSTAADWTCVTNKAAMTEFKECIAGKNNMVGDKASCGKRECVTDNIDCDDKAKEMYIHAVNIEMNMEIKDMSMAKDCNTASGIQLSLLSIAACLLVLFS